MNGTVLAFSFSGTYESAKAAFERQWADVTQTAACAKENLAEAASDVWHGNFREAFGRVTHLGCPEQPAAKPVGHWAQQVPGLNYSPPLTGFTPMQPASADAEPSVSEPPTLAEFKSGGHIFESQIGGFDNDSTMLREVVIERLHQWLPEQRAGHLDTQKGSSIKLPQAATESPPAWVIKYETQKLLENSLNFTTSKQLKGLVKDLDNQLKRLEKAEKHEAKAAKDEAAQHTSPPRSAESGGGSSASVKEGDTISLPSPGMPSGYSPIDHDLMRALDNDVGVQNIFNDGLDRAY